MKRNIPLNRLSLLSMMIILFVIASLSIAMAVQLPIKLGGKNDPDDVRLLQQSLNECDDYSLKVDGIYGPATSSAVKDFQRRNMLTIDGIVGPQTWSKLASVVDIGPVDTTTGSGTTNTSSASEQVLPEESAAIIEPSAGASVQVAKSFSGSIGSNDTYTSRSVISDYSSNAAIAASSSDNASDFWKDRSTWLQPLKGAQTANPTGGARYFGASRANGARAHAGIDFIAPPGTPVYAMTDGEVKRISLFFQNTSAVEVQNSDGTIARYCEIEPLVSVNQTVHRGDIIGKVVANYAGTSMLHLEMYQGTASGSLTQGSNSSNYLYVTVLNYQRRADLIDPTGAKDLPWK